MNEKISLSVFADIIELAYEEYTNLFDIYIYVRKYRPNLSEHALMKFSESVFWILFDEKIINLFENSKNKKNKHSNFILLIQRSEVRSKISEFSWKSPKANDIKILVISVTEFGKAVYESNSWQTKISKHINHVI